MPLSFKEMFGMALRHSPISKIRTAMVKCEAAGLNVTAMDLESHHLCGGDLLMLMEALVTAKQVGIETTFQEMSAITLAGQDPLALVNDASIDRMVSFDTFSPKRGDRIRGFTQDRTEVSAVITVVYRLSPGQLAFRYDFQHVQERLGAAVSVFINTAPDLRTLQMRRTEHEAELRLLGMNALPGIKSVAVDYV